MVAPREGVERRTARLADALFTGVRGRGILKCSDARSPVGNSSLKWCRKAGVAKTLGRRSPPRLLREETDLVRLDEDPVRVVLSQPHSTGRPSPKRYENRYDQELRIDRSMPAPATHEDMGVAPRMWRWGTQVFSSISVLMMHTPLTPSQSDEDRSSRPP
jgi:hypothetical protein